MTCNFSEVCNVPEFVKDTATIDAIAYECLRFKTMLPDYKEDKETILLRLHLMNEHLNRGLEIGHVELIKQYQGYKLLSRATSQWYHSKDPDNCFLTIYVEKDDTSDPDEEHYGELLTLNKKLEIEYSTKLIHGMERGYAFDAERGTSKGIISRYYRHELYSEIAASYKRQYDALTEKLIADSCLR